MRPSRQQRERRTHSRLYRLALGLAVAVVGTGAAIAGPGVIQSLLRDAGPQPIAAAPADDPAHGLVYTGLSPARKGTPCVGGYQVTERAQCSHGPDGPPAGLDVHQMVAASAPATTATSPVRETVVGPKDTDVVADEGGVAAADGFTLVPDAGSGAAQFTITPAGIACDGDGVTGRRVQVLYVRAAGTASRFAQYLESFRTWAAGVDTIYNASAQETGGSRHVRFVTTADCKVDVQEVEVPAGGMDTFGTTITDLKNLGYGRTDRKYLIFGDSQVYCGIGTFAGDPQPGSANRSNGGPGYGRSDSGCWAASVAAHELGHNLGAVNNNAPNSSKAGHCLDEYDVMCYNDSGGLKTSVKCADRSHDQRLDCNHDDYYNTNPSPGSYLATNWNVANNLFLVNGDGGGTTPNPTPTPTASPTKTATPTPTATASPTKTATPTPSPSKTSASPSKSPTATSDPGGLKELRVSDTTTTSIRLAWDAAAGGSRYAIVVNGHSIGQVSSTRVRIVGMRPSTEYQVGISLAKADGTLSQYTKTVNVKTTAVQAPTAGSWTVLANSLTGGVVDVFGSRKAAGTPVIIYRLHGGANQQWKLTAVSGGYRLQSKASGLCLSATDAEGSPVTQAACDTALVWTVTTGADGTALTSPTGLVLGVGNAHYLGSRVLTLQRASGARYQDWTAHTA